MSKNLHAPAANGAGYTLCGLALEAGDDGAVTGETENPKLAPIGRHITCVDCIRVVDHVQQMCATTRTWIRRI